MDIVCPRMRGEPCNSLTEPIGTPQTIHVFSTESPAAQRARIVSSRAFRRLAHKTQVLTLPRSDHVSTRLTHTLEVASLARDVATRLATAGCTLDLDLVETIALAHDVGHPPFGHAGEAALARRAADAGLGGFHHAAFGVRLLSRLELVGGAPVVTSAAVLDGVLAHSKGKSGAAFARGSAARRRSLEAHVVRAADLYAYASFDLDDALRLGVFTVRALPARARRELGKSGDAIRRSLVERTSVSLIERTRPAPIERTRLAPVEPTVDSEASEPVLSLDPEADAALAELRAFLYERFYEGSPTADQTRRADEVVGTIWRSFERDLDGTLSAIGWARRDDRSGRATLRDALDAAACMTDRFALGFAAQCLHRAA
jgi:dGTPase